MPTFTDKVQVEGAFVRQETPQALLVSAEWG